MTKFPETTRMNASLTLIYSFLACLIEPSVRPTTAEAKVPNLFRRDRRQLEVCIVTILRVRYFSESLGQKLQQLLVDATDTTRQEPFKQLDKIKALYLEARLGSKAILTGKIGGGATEKVLSLATFDLKNCLDDARYWYKYLKMDLNSAMDRNILDRTSADIMESLAAIVEFDGLETTQDPSPRSSLALKMFSLDKAVFVQRMLLERIVPTCDSFVNVFGSKRLVCEQFIRLNYPDELPATTSAF
jgi:hypothetical protein